MTKPHLLLGLYLWGCAPMPQLTAVEASAGRAAKEAWAAKRMPEPTENRCDLSRFYVVVPDAIEYRRYCPHSDPWKTAGCLAWKDSNHLYAWVQWPVVVISPKHYSEPTIVVHELMHAYQRCSKLGRPGWDLGDREHSDPRVWSAAGGENAVQTLANELAVPQVGVKLQGLDESEPVD